MQNKSQYLKEWGKFLFCFFSHLFLIPFIVAFSLIVKFLVENPDLLEGNFDYTLIAKDIQQPMMLLSLTLALVLMLLMYRKQLPPLPEKIDAKKYLTLLGVSLVAIIGLNLIRGLFLSVFFPGVDLVPDNQKIIEQTPLLLVFYVAVIVAPLLEEIIYRLALFRLFPKKRFLGMIFSVLLFVFIHVNMGKAPLEMMIEVSAYLPLSAVFSYLYYKYDDFYLVWALHTLSNFFAVLMIALK